MYFSLHPHPQYAQTLSISSIFYTKTTSSEFRYYANTLQQKPDAEQKQKSARYEKTPPENKAVCCECAHYFKSNIDSNDVSGYSSDSHDITMLFR